MFIEAKVIFKPARLKKKYFVTVKDKETMHTFTFNESFIVVQVNPYL